jgi:hypothetical protein
VVLGVHVGAGCDERSDDSAIAVHRRPVQRGVATTVHGGAGVRGVAPRGYPSTQSVPEHKTAGSPRGSTAVSFWVNANGKSTPGGLRAVATSHPARASTKRAKLQKVAETAIAGEGGGEKLGDSAIWQGSVLVTELDVMTGTEERLHARSKLPEGRLT